MKFEKKTTRTDALCATELLSKRGLLGLVIHSHNLILVSSLSTSQASPARTYCGLAAGLRAHLSAYYYLFKATRHSPSSPPSFFSFLRFPRRAVSTAYILSLFSFTTILRNVSFPLLQHLFFFSREMPQGVNTRHEGSIRTVSLR